MLRPSRRLPGRARPTPADAARHRLDSGSGPVDVTAVLTFDGGLTERALVDRLEERLLGHPRFRRRVVAARSRLGRPRWEDEPDFSIDAHLRRVRAHAPGGRQELEALVGELMNEPLDEARSPWRAVLVDGLPEGGRALVVQVHQCLGDCFSLVDVLLSLADDDGPPAERRGIVGWPVPTPATAARELPRVVARSTLALARSARTGAAPPTSLRGERGGRCRASWSRAVSAVALEDRAHASGLAPGEVLLAAVTGALRRYLRERGELASPLRAVVPVDVRPHEATAVLARGSRLGLSSVDLPVDHPDRATRERILRAQIARAPLGLQALGSRSILDVASRLPPADRALGVLFAREASLVVTHVPGPSAPLRVAGAPLRELVFWGPQPRLALGVSVIGYAGELRIGVRTDTRAAPHPERIVGLIEDELDLGLATPARERVPVSPSLS